MSIYKSKLSKEDFKTIMTECFKAAWITYSKENFEQALKWKQEKKYEYNIDIGMNEDDEFNTTESAIDLFETYSQLFIKEDDSDSLKKWEEAWEAPDGFEITNFINEQIEDGNDIGEQAINYFEILNSDSNIKNNENKKTLNLEPIAKFNDAVLETSKALKDNNISYIYEAAFMYDEDNFKVRCDILKNNGNKHLEIIEFKATSEVKSEHIFDLMYQVWVLQKLGYIIDNVYIGHISKSYLVNFDTYGETLKDYSKKFVDSLGIVKWDEIKNIVNKEININESKKITDVDLNNFLIIDNVFKDYKKNGKIFIFENIKSFIDEWNLDSLILKYTNLFALPIDKIEKILNFDFCDSPFSFSPHILKWKKKSDELYCYHIVQWFDKNRETIFNFTNLNKDLKAKIYRTLNKVYLDDISSLDEKGMPTKTNGKTLFNEAHNRIFDTYKKYQNNKYEIHWDDCLYKENIKELKKMLDKYKDYPIYMYDFETAKWAVPRFEKSGGYQQIPFQYSIDIIDDDNYDYNNISTMFHAEFIANKKVDPRPKFIKHFIKDMFIKGPGVYVAYNKSFEQTVLKYLATLFPKYAKPLLYIAQNTIDLMDFFKGSSKTNIPWFLIYHPKFHGSYSIKKTQPALDIKFSYDDLSINKGDKASQIFRQYIDDYYDDEGWELIKPNMIDYCNRDTLAMVVILKRINEIYNNYIIKEEK